MYKRILKFIELKFPKGECIVYDLYPEQFELFHVRFSFCYGGYIRSLLSNNQQALLMIKKSFLGVGYNDKELPAYGYIPSIKPKRILTKVSLALCKQNIHVAQPINY